MGAWTPKYRRPSMGCMVETKEWDGEGRETDAYNVPHATINLSFRFFFWQS